MVGNVWKFHFIFKIFANSWVIDEVNLGPLSDWREAENPKHGIISWESKAGTVESLIVNWKDFNPSSKHVYQDEKILCSSYRRHVGGVMSPVHGWKDS